MVDVCLRLCGSLTPPSAAQHYSLCSEHMSFLTRNELTFSPLREQDFPQLLHWLKTPHMKDKRDLIRELSDIRSQFTRKIGSDWQEAFIVSLHGNLFAYIQSYRATRAGDGWWPNEGNATVGIDRFIGEAEFLNRGLGTVDIRSQGTKSPSHVGRFTCARRRTLTQAFRLQGLRLVHLGKPENAPCGRGEQH